MTSTARVLINGTTRFSTACCVVAAGLWMAAGSASAQEFDLAELVDTYAAAWNESDSGRRAELLRRCWAPEGTYVDPTAVVVGRDALHAHIGGFRADMRGARIERSSGVDIHHGWLRFTWRIVAADGTELGRGFDVGELGEDGLLLRIVGFFGDLPEG